jgi:hypothetical protein
MTNRGFDLTLPCVAHRDGGCVHAQSDRSDNSQLRGYGIGGSG